CLVPPEGETLHLDALHTMVLPSAPPQVELWTAPSEITGAARPIQNTTLELDSRPLGVMAALARLVGAEAQLYEDAVGVVEGELARVAHVLPTLERAAEDGTSIKVSTLQFLADTLLFATRNVSRGLNHLPLGELLRAAGVEAELPPDGIA